jgi:DNA-binding NarL/FixJ family response regulator
MAEPRIRVLIVDDHEVVRRGLRTFLDLQDDIEVIGEAADGEQCVGLAAELGPDVILLDLKMPGGDGVTALRRLRARGDRARALVVTSFTDIPLVLPAIRAGASGCVSKDIDPQALAGAIRAVHAGHVLLPPDLATALLRSDERVDRLGQLTAREREVLGEIARGRSNREIARSLVLAEKTVKTHVSNILTKLDVADRTQAALYAVRHGLTDNPAA